jgi:hypothetical protein
MNPDAGTVSRLIILFVIVAMMAVLVRSANRGYAANLQRYDEAV